MSLWRLSSIAILYSILLAFSNLGLAPLIITTGYMAIQNAPVSKTNNKILIWCQKCINVWSYNRGLVQYTTAKKKQLISSAWGLQPLCLSPGEFRWHNWNWRVVISHSAVLLFHSRELETRFGSIHYTREQRSVCRSDLGTAKSKNNVGPFCNLKGK